jgi:hypothetical protein
MTPLKFHAGWWCMFWGLIAHLGLGYVSPIFDPHTAAYTPLHNHLILGVQNADRERILAEHRHGYFEAIHPHGLPTLPGSPAPIVISASRLLDAFLTVYGIGADLWAGLDWPATQPAYSLWLTAMLTAIFLTSFACSPPLPPPRPV